MTVASVPQQTTFEQLEARISAAEARFVAAETRFEQEIHDVFKALDAERQRTDAVVEDLDRIRSKGLSRWRKWKERHRPTNVSANVSADTPSSTPSSSLVVVVSEVVSEEAGARFPPSETALALFEQSQVTASLDEGFDAFWRAYPRKTAKVDALKAWKKLRPSAALVTRILAAIGAQQTWATWIDGYVPHPATWLNKGRWEDEEPPRVNRVEQKQRERLDGIRAWVANRERRG